MGLYYIFSQRQVIHVALYTSPQTDNFKTEYNSMDSTCFLCLNIRKNLLVPTTISCILSTTQ